MIALVYLPARQKIVVLAILMLVLEDNGYEVKHC